MATFNVWNNNDTWAMRKEAIINEIIRINADVIALQEVPCLQEIKFISKQVGINHYHFMQYQGEEEGLAILSKYPLEKISITNDVLNQCAQRVIVDLAGLNIGITNVHLNWKSVSTRETEIMEVINWISKSNSSDYELLCGDFNSIPNISSIYNFLVGEVSLNKIDTSWVDLGQSLKSPTLDFINNSWLHNRDNLNTIRVPVRFDWILLKSCYPKKEPKLSKIEVFANKTTSLHQFLPSDHYGVYIDLSF
ncbi:endonuclease/exonuclease/phosphatase family protein [Lederbergia citrea]|uniref:endonuclease/exonuclease/phosphatase family protein n=1 Tax=Lederbergia citrea TaxID=2833581 RepID=UPI001BC97220|nr:endonuclease/exonuclease/phosphatase family protein [Lederbergia citrea]